MKTMFSLLATTITFSGTISLMGLPTDRAGIAAGSVLLVSMLFKRSLA